MDLSHLGQVDSCFRPKAVLSVRKSEFHRDTAARSDIVLCTSGH